MNKKNLTLKQLLELDSHDNMTGVGVPFIGGFTKFGSGEKWSKGNAIAGGLSEPTQRLKDKTEEELELSFIDSGPAPVGNASGINALEELVDIGRNPMIDAQSPNTNNRQEPLVNQQLFVPPNAPMGYEDVITGRKAEYMDNINTGDDPSWPIGIGEDQLHMKNKKIIKKNAKLDKKIDKLIGPTQKKDLEDSKEGHRATASDIILYNMIEEIVAEELALREQHLNGLTPSGAGGTYPSKQGWNNNKIASLCAHKNNMDPSKPPAEVWHNKFEENDDQNPLMTQHAPEADSSPMGGMGMIGWPKQFVPKDIEQDPNYGQFIDSPNGNRGVIDSTLPNNMMNLNLKEYMTMQHNPKRRLKKKRNIKSIYGASLPSNNAPGNPRPMNGAVAFEKSRDNVLSQLKEVIRTLVLEQIEENEGVVETTADTNLTPETFKAKFVNIKTGNEVFNKNDEDAIIDFLIDNDGDTLSKTIIDFTEEQYDVIRALANNPRKIPEKAWAKLQHKLEVTDTDRSHKKSSLSRDNRINASIDARGVYQTKAQQIGQLPRLSTAFTQQVGQYYKQISDSNLPPDTKSRLKNDIAKAQLAPGVSEKTKLQDIINIVKSTAGEDMFAAAALRTTRPLPGPAPAPPPSAFTRATNAVKSTLGLKETEMAEFLNEHNIRTERDLRVLIRIINEETRRERRGR